MLDTARTAKVDLRFCWVFTGTVKVWDPRQRDSPVANMEPMEGETKRDCWTVAFGKLNFSPDQKDVKLQQSPCLNM